MLQLPLDPVGKPPPFVATTPADAPTRRLALALAVVSLVFFIVAAPYARVQLPKQWAFIPLYESALAIGDLIATNLLLAQFAFLRSRAILILACGYFFAALMVIPHALTFPGLFSPEGLLGGHTASAPWLYLIWHLFFPLFVIGYGLRRPRDDMPSTGLSIRMTIVWALSAVIVAVSLFTFLTTAGADVLPVAIINNRFTPTFSWLAGLASLLSFSAFIVLWRRRRQTVLDLWLCVSMCAWTFDIALSAALDQTRYDVGYYIGRAYGLLAAGFILIMLLRETNIVYAGVLAQLASEQEARKRDIADSRRLFNTSLDLIMTVDPDETIERVNPSALAILGLLPDEMIDRSLADFIDPGDLDENRKQMDMMRSGKIMRNFQCRYRHKDGRTATLAWTGLWSAPDERYFLFGRDITEQKHGEEKFRLAVESCPNGMLMIDSEGIIRLVNAQTETMFGYSRDELIGQSVDMLVPTKLRHRHAQHRAGFIGTPETKLMGHGRDFFGLRKDGSEFPVEVALNPIQAPDGLLVLSVITDISERKRIERMKDEFVSTVSHELRTPLTSIAASLGLLSRGAHAQLPDNLSRLVTIAHANSQRLVRLINDILDIEKIESGKMVFTIVRIDIRRLVEQAVEASQGYAAEFGVNLKLDAAAATGDVAADCDRLTQVFTNLISNSVKFSPRGGEVLVAVAARGGMMRVSVRDHGPGIAEDFKPRIFEKFAQADATDARQKGGTGLGLSIVKQLVARLGGDVSFEDAPGGGTIFHVDLPALEPQVAATGRDGQVDHDTHILICDDYPLGANILAEQLGKFGFTADIVTNGRAAAEHAQATHYAAILIDLQLPDCDGVSLIQQLRAQPENRDTPIVVVSNDPERGRGDIRSSSLDVLDWLQKPVDLTRLTQLIERPHRGVETHRPRILHVDDDQDVLRFVSRSLTTTATLTSVDSIDRARHMLNTERFDLAIVDIALATGSGLDLLPDLHDLDGNAIPVILMSAQGANPACAAQVQAALIKSQTSVEQLITTLRRRVPSRGAAASVTEREMS